MHDPSTDEWPVIVEPTKPAAFNPWLASVGLLLFVAAELIVIRLFMEASP